MSALIEGPPTDAEERDLVEITDAAGNVIERHYGTTEAEREAAHKAGKCTFMCGYCYKEACEYAESLDARKERTTP